jgi:hypothetical protein
VKVRDLIRELLGYAMDSEVYVGKGMGPLAKAVPETCGNTGTDRMFVILSPGGTATDLSGIESAVRADERHKCGQEIREAAKGLDTIGMLTLVRAATFDAADIIDPPPLKPDAEAEQ